MQNSPEDGPRLVNDLGADRRDEDEAADVRNILGVQILRELMPSPDQLVGMTFHRQVQELEQWLKDRRADYAQGGESACAAVAKVAAVVAAAAGAPSIESLADAAFIVGLAAAAECRRAGGDWRAALQAMRVEFDGRGCPDLFIKLHSNGDAELRAAVAGLVDVRSGRGRTSKYKLVADLAVAIGLPRLEPETWEKKFDRLRRMKADRKHET